MPFLAFVVRVKTLLIIPAPVFDYIRRPDVTKRADYAIRFSEESPYFWLYIIPYTPTAPLHAHSTTFARKLTYR
jgi:hypothetical protein